jgi:serine/threonine protein kinase
MKMEELLPSGSSPAAVDLIKRMLEVEPTKRISADKALTHEFFYDI